MYQRVAAKRGHNVAVVAVARKLAELVWHLLTKEEEFIYQTPRLTREKRSRVRLLARGRTKRKAASAEPPLVGRPALQGSGLKGKTVTTAIARQAAEQSEAICRAIVAGRASGAAAATVIAEAGFDPTRLVSAD